MLEVIADFVRDHLPESFEMTAGLPDLPYNFSPMITPFEVLVFSSDLVPWDQLPWDQLSPIQLHQINLARDQLPWDQLPWDQL